MRGIKIGGRAAHLVWVLCVHIHLLVLLEPGVCCIPRHLEHPRERPIREARDRTLSGAPVDNEVERLALPAARGRRVL